MITITMTVETDNAAFKDHGTECELARMLKELAICVKRGERDGTPRDFNGNVVGTWERLDT